MTNRRSMVAAAMGSALLTLIFVVPLTGRAHGGHQADSMGTAARRPPRTYDVEHYVIRTRFNRQTRTVFGDVSVRLRALDAPVRSFELDAAALKIESVILEGDGKPLRWKTTTDRLSIALPRAFEKSEAFTVRIVYRAQPKKGLYFIPAIDGPPTRAQPAQIWTQGEAEENRYWFPGYDFPDDKATVEQYITTTAPEEMAISNGVLVDVKKNPDGTRTFHWSMDQVFSSYLISMVVGDFAQIKDRVGDIDLEYNTYRKTENIVRPVFAKTPKMLRWYEKVLGVPFPYRRYAQTIVASFIFGGMENITATTMADTEILFARPNDAENSADDLISHELAHSWFGDLVTCRDWSELWLNEGLATFMEASFAESEGGRPAYLKKLAEDRRELFADDLPDQRHPLVNRNYSTGMELFDTTTYKKGGFVIHMLRETVGDEVFWKALRAYIEEFRHDNVTSADLKAVFERESGKDLTWFFKQWVYQSGFPDLVVQYEYDATAKKLNLTVTQRQTGDGHTPEVFRLPLEIQVKTSRGSQTVLAEVNQRSQKFSFAVAEDPSAVTVDPQMNLLVKSEVSRLGVLAPVESGIQTFSRTWLGSGE